MVAHDASGIEHQAFVLLTVAQVFNKQVAVGLAGKHIDPAYGGEGDEVHPFFVGDGVFVAHVLKVKPKCYC